MNVVWHGHYLSYFEEGRRAFGRKFGLDYPVFLQNRVGAPLVKTAVEYLSPARMTDVIQVSAKLLDSEGAKLEFEFEITEKIAGQVLARGTSTQVFTTLEGDLILTRPQFILDLYEQWEGHWVEPA